MFLCILGEGAFGCSSAWASGGPRVLEGCSSGLRPTVSIAFRRTARPSRIGAAPPSLAARARGGAPEPPQAPMREARAGLRELMRLCSLLPGDMEAGPAR
ncbi:unnamed protein product [Prorocentrum cordatum]|uniref:Uncharacterized protein n=1 Tax=Prorocentrum cordatum TaxID=2364126 RepID=A0ABN9PYZ5_9DINO|nr:unnamed protein product [Polarella glacialis]